MQGKRETLQGLLDPLECLGDQVTLKIIPVKKKIRLLYIGQKGDSGGLLGMPARPGLPGLNGPIPHSGGPVGPPGLPEHLGLYFK